MFFTKMVTTEDLRRKFDELAKDGFIGEAVLRFSGSNHDGLFIMPKDVREDKRPNQNIALIMNIYSLCRNVGAFGSITIIWNDGLIKNYTVKLTFQGIDASFQASNIFRNGG